MDFLLGFVRRARIKRLLERYVIPALDLLLAPATLAAAFLMKALRRAGVWRLPVSRAIFDRVGVFPIRDHYYEHFFHPRHLRVASEVERELPGIDFDVAVQLNLLDSLCYEAELAAYRASPRSMRLPTTILTLAPEIPNSCTARCATSDPLVS